MSTTSLSQEQLLLLTATHFVPAGFLLLLTVSCLCFQVLDCRRAVRQDWQKISTILRSWSYSVSGLPDTPSSSNSYGYSFWSAVGARHVVQILLSVTATLSTIVIYVEINALLLVIIYILFIIATILDIIASNPRYLMIPVRSEGLITGLAFLSLTLFVLNSQQGEEERVQRGLLVLLTCGCTVLCWVETFCAEFQTCQTVRFCQHALSLLTVTWLGQAGVISFLQVSVEDSLLITLFSCHIAVISIVFIILAVCINKSLLSQFSRQVSKPGSIIGSSILSSSSGGMRRTNKY